MKKFLVGKRISLHGVSPDELRPDGPYAQWLDDMSLDQYTERSYFPNTQERMQTYYKAALENRSSVLLGIYDNTTSRHIGNITFNDINWFNRRAFISYLLGDSEFAGQGLTTDAVLMMMYYGFNRLNFHRIWGGVSALHSASRKVCTKTGLLEEGLYRQHLLRNGEYSDVVLVGALRDEWMRTHGEAARALFEVSPTY